MAKGLEQGEQLLTAAFELVSQENALSWDKKALVMGRFMCRMVLFLVNKQKLGREKNKVYDSLQEINDLFGKEVIALCTDGKLKATSPATTQKDEDTKLVQLGDTTDPCFIALRTNPHIKKGSLYMHRDHGSKVFKFEEMKAREAVFIHKPFFGPEEKVEVLHKDLKVWKPYPKDEPQLIPPETLKKLQPAGSGEIGKENTKHLVQAAIFKNYLKQLALIFVLFEALNKLVSYWWSIC